MKVYARASAFTAIATLAVGAGLCFGQMQPQQTMQYPRQQNQQPAIPSMAPNGQSPALSDAQVQQNVQNQLDADPSLKAAGVSATVTNGQVMLMGMVPDNTLKKRAAALARSVAGVNGVENMISVSPAAAASEPAAPAATEPNAPNHSAAPAPASTPNAAATPAANSAYQPPYGPSARAVRQNGLGNGAGGMALETRVTDALASDPVLGRYAITATVNQHNDVTLHGVVPTKMDKRKAKNLVKAMSGVHKVHNKLRVNPNATILTNPKAPEAGGNPGSNAAARIGQNPAGMSPAQQKAHPPGDILASQNAAGSGTPVIPQQPANASSNPATGAPAAASTADMQQQVTEALHHDPVLQPYDITGVITKPGTVTLQGSVPAKADRKHAEMLVKGIPGITHVHNKIQVNPNASPATPPDPPSPPAANPQNGQSRASSNPATGAPAAAMTRSLQHRVTTAFQQDPILSQYRVQGIVTGRGQVTLQGVVPSKADRKHAALVAKGVMGVSHIENKIKVSPTARQAAPPDPPAPAAAQSSSQSPTPQNVRTELQARLQGNPKLSGVVVYVSGHTVTLRGNVANRAGRKHAVQIVKSSLPKNYTVRDHIAINKGMGNGYPPLL